MMKSGLQSWTGRANAVEMNRHRDDQMIEDEQYPEQPSLCRSLDNSHCNSMWCMSIDNISNILHIACFAL